MNKDQLYKIVFVDEKTTTTVASDLKYDECVELIKMQLHPSFYRIEKELQYDDYRKEYETLLMMFRCSTRYLNFDPDRQNMGEEQEKVNREVSSDFRDFYYKYSEKINAECLKNTGKKVW